MKRKIKGKEGGNQKKKKKKKKKGKKTGFGCFLAFFSFLWMRCGYSFRHLRKYNSIKRRFIAIRRT
jgi:hypothetical protein